MLACPKKLSSAPGKVNIDVNTVTPRTRTGETTNHSAELPGSEEMNQSTAGPKKMRYKT